MTDSRFFPYAGPLRLAEIAEAAGANLPDDANPNTYFDDVAPLSHAEGRDVSFLDNPRYRDVLVGTRAGACILTPAMASEAPTGTICLTSDNPYRSYAHTARAFHPKPQRGEGRHASATVADTAHIGRETSIDAHAVIGDRAVVGERCRIGAGAVIGAGVEIGDACDIGPLASIEVCLIGNRVRIHTGARVGQRGFGFDASDFPYEDVPQLGRVLVEDDVEIGANSTIDRGSASDTVIGAGSRLDNLVQVGHNVRLGRGCILVSQTGIAGSTQLDDFVMLGGQAGVAGHLRLGKGAQVAAKGGVMEDVAAGMRVAGFPAFPAREYFRLVAMWRRMLKTKDK